MEGVGRGYGEVRGQLGGCDLVNYTTPKNGHVGGVVGSGSGVGNSGVGNSLKSPYQIYQRSYSLPIPGGGVNGVPGGPGGQCASSVCGETELSFNGGSSGAALAVNNGYYNNNGGGRRSPVGYNRQYGGNGGGSDAGGSTARSLSPLSWVNGNEMKGVMKWFA